MNAPDGWFGYLFVFLLGLEFGSFANVCVYRWPRSSSVVRPRRSFCPWCGHGIAWRDNIPVVSFILLGRRCRHCRSPISIRYPAVELTMAVTWLAAYRHFGTVDSLFDVAFLSAAFCFLFVAIVTTMTDLDWRLIPDTATALLAGVGLLTSLANPLLGPDPAARVVSSLLGIAAGAGSLWVVGEVGERIFQREAMGGGDVKLLAAIGAVLGWRGALSALLLAAILGGCFAVIGLLTGRLRRNQYIPFGPFLNAAGIAVLFGFAGAVKTIDFLRF